MHQSAKQFLVFINSLIIYSIWLRKYRKLQFLTILSLLTVILSWVVNFYVPLYAQKIVDSLTGLDNQPQQYRWDLVVIFATLKGFQGFGALSLVTILQQIMWLPVEQHIRHFAQVKFFHHVHTMSFNWMLRTKMGDILGALERGIESIASTIEHLLYCILPTIGDIVIAITYLSIKFGWAYALIVALQLLLYIIFTAFVIEKRSIAQSSVNQSEDSLRQKALESAVNFETVKCFGNEKCEMDRYSHSLMALQGQKFKIEVLTSLLEIVQQAIICMGLLACSLLLLSSVRMGGEQVRVTAGDYVLLVSYLAQLYGPLNYLAGYYRELRVNIVNAESMMEYFMEMPEIRDSPLAYKLQITGGAIEFRNVCLTGDSEDEVILNDVSFTVAPKTTVALVGPTGSGKTSIARLLLRLQDPTSGEVLIDGVNVNDVTMESLRRSIGIVPQDTSLFNDTISKNIRYGKLAAFDHEVDLAARLAQIHQRIMAFPEEYDTIVGERGAILSGGERQRVAISRAILKDPPIVILDEATSALDAKTENRMHEILGHFCKTRTCLMITHNLASTIYADTIIVLQNGRIVETGSHESLLGERGLFAAMWKNIEGQADNRKH